MAKSNATINIEININNSGNNRKNYVFIICKKHKDIG